MEKTSSSLFSPLRPPSPTPPTLYHPRLFHLRFDFPCSSLVTRASPSSQGSEATKDWIGEWVSKNDGFVRIMPILVGGVSLVAVLLNRAFSSLAPVADASRKFTVRADILTLSLAVTDILTASSGSLFDLNIYPQDIMDNIKFLDLFVNFKPCLFSVAPSGVECKRIKLV